MRIAIEDGWQLPGRLGQLAIWVADTAHGRDGSMAIIGEYCHQ
jgi:hypothetical protein